MTAEATIALSELSNWCRGRKKSDGSWNVESSIESDSIVETVLCYWSTSQCEHEWHTNV
jgi:hypothetical protein